MSGVRLNPINLFKRRIRNIRHLCIYNHKKIWILSNHFFFNIMAEFEEEWSKIENGYLIIKWYYFPTATNLKIDIDKILDIQVRSQASSYKKNWGSSSLKTWWACDMKRNFRSKPEGFHNVTINIGDTFKKGFTVQDLNKFLSAMRKYLKNQSIVFK
ncbi:unnamed protein product [Caenorhabditis angaria]|uniref:Uncharacterized protein n=1 Tax=Caenorhabditis angaria TaxID=860376 RepID=A0A9P1J618_9PELO|nr:unnamed protein product [Caenorhabditis angaria]